MNIVQAPDRVLSEKAKPVGKITKDIVTLIEEMKTTLLACKDPEGIGLAAPQVGKSLQIFIIKESKKSPFYICINPVVTLQRAESKPSFASSVAKAMDDKKAPQGKKDDILEGCLSLKNIWGHVKRSPAVEVQYLD